MGKRKYRVCNWRNYNKALVERGNITYWISQNVIDEWGYSGKRDRGGVKKYSDSAITASLVLRELFRLPYRMCEGFLRSLFAQLKLGKVNIPSYSTLCRRAKDLSIAILGKQSNRPVNILIDSTGVSLYGEGEWKRKKHGEDKQKAWVKLHVAVDSKKQTIMSMVTSSSRSQDASHFPALLEAVKAPVRTIYADGAYDKLKCYEAAAEKGASLLTPPQRRARLQCEMRPCDRNPAYHIRDIAIQSIRAHDELEYGRKQWKINSGYHRRSMVENTMFRLKTAFGESVRCTTITRQIKQLELRCYILNRLTALGMPKSVAVA